MRERFGGRVYFHRKVHFFLTHSFYGGVSCTHACADGEEEEVVVQPFKVFCYQLSALRTAPSCGQGRDPYWVGDSFRLSKSPNCDPGAVSGLLQDFSQPTAIFLSGQNTC